MRNNETSVAANLTQSALPRLQRNPDSADRRPTIVGPVSANRGGLFGGWGPRLGM